MFKVLRMLVCRKESSHSNVIATKNLDTDLPIKICKPTSENLVKRICISCQRETNQNECSCGSKSFVVGDKVLYNNHKVFCGCGNDTFIAKNSFNQLDVYIKVYRCSHCSKTVEIHHHLEREGIACIN